MFVCVPEVVCGGGDCAFAQGATKKVKGVTDAGLPTKRLDCVAVLGGGLMGSGIATALALSGCQVGGRTWGWESVPYREDAREARRDVAVASIRGPFEALHGQQSFG